MLWNGVLMYSVNSRFSNLNPKPQGCGLNFFWPKSTGCVPNFVTGCDFHNVRIVDCGDIDIDEYDEVDYDGARDALRQKVSQALSNGFIPFVIGGSNDQSYANACALLEHFPDTGLGVVNLDAHLDVRPQKAGLEHSGSPFRQLLEDQRFCRPMR